MRTTLWGAAMALLAFASQASRADVLHLQGGGTIDAEHWWIEGNTIQVESKGGVVGLPRTMLIKVEPTSPKAPPVGSPQPPLV